MSPGKPQMGENTAAVGSGHRSTDGKGHSQASTRRRSSGESMANSLASQLENETEEKKEVIMNEAINCIFNHLPEDILKLNSLLAEVSKLHGDQYSDDAWLVKAAQYGQVDSAIYPHAAKYAFAFASSAKVFPTGKSAPKEESDPKGSKKDSIANGKHLLRSSCARHLVNRNGEPMAAGEEHTCSKSYTFPNAINLLPWGTVNANEALSKFVDQLRAIFVQQSQHFVLINLGLSLMFPRTEDNEHSNLSIDVLNKLLELASLDYLDFFESNVSHRAELIGLVCTYPHFGEARRMLFEFDRNSCLQLQMIVQNLITHCGRLYDSLVKNFDMVLKAKKQCNQQTKPDSPSSTSPAHNYYS